MDIKIKVLSAPDWQEYKTIRLQALREEPHAFGSNYERESSFSEQEWKERPGNKDTILLVAKKGMDPIGMAKVHFETDEKNQKIGHIWGMFVAKEYRGKGIGKMLMEELINKVQQQEDVHAISLMVNGEQQAAQSLYTSLGFAETGTKEWVLGDGVSHQLRVMEMILDNLPR